MVGCNLGHTTLLLCFNFEQVIFNKNPHLSFFLFKQVGNYGALFAQALPRDAHSTPFYCTRPQSLALGYGERSAGLSASLGTSGISSLGVYSLNGPTPTPQSLLAG